MDELPGMWEEADFIDTRLQMATPGTFDYVYSVDEEATIQRSMCKFCRKEIGYWGQALFPNWYHLDGGSRVCDIK